MKKQPYSESVRILELLAALHIIRKFNRLVNADKMSGCFRNEAATF